MRKRIIGYIGVSIILLGCGLVFVTLGVHFKYKMKMDSLLENRVILIESSSEVNFDEDESYLGYDINLEGIDADQEIDIKSGTPVINIPSLDILVPVVDGTDKESLKYGAGKFSSSVDMGEMGNFSVAGHSSTIYNCIFNNLESIELLDKIECFDSSGNQFNYYVVDKFKVESTNMSVVSQTSDATMTIVTCTDKGLRRFVVIAKLMTDSQFLSYKENFERFLVDRAVEIADRYSEVDILGYLQDTSITEYIDYGIDFSIIKEKKDSFFTNYTMFKDKLKMNEHDFYSIFAQPVGFDFSMMVLEVTNSDI